MSNRDQLEIIAANGQIEFYDLDPGKGLTNIGRHPENDIVIDDPTIAPFHAMLDHRHRPYQFVLLSGDGSTRLRGQMLYPNGATLLQNLDSIELGSYTLILMEGSGVRPSTTVGRLEPATPVISSPTPTTPMPVYEPPPTSPTLPARPAPISPPPTRPERISRPRTSTPPPLPQPQTPAPSATATTPSAPAQGVAGYFTSLPPTLADEFIVTELSDNEATIDVEQTAAFELTLTNGGPLVAAFAVTVEGIDPGWLTISQPLVNLYEGERTSVLITITPPRLPSSRAGKHYFAISVTSADYPDHHSQYGVTLVINPYYEFGVGELTPKQQTLSWFRRSGQASLLVMNKGNSTAPLRLEGSDDERACSFEFQLPGEEVGLAMQAEMHLPPEESVSVPIRITPHSRRLFGFRKRTYAYTISTVLLEGALTPRSMLGQLRHKALFGLWQILLLALLLVVLIVYIFRPTIDFFSAEPRMVRAGEEVLLRWRASPFANLRINGGVGAVDENIGEIVVTPQEDTTYELRSENWVSWLTSGLLSYRREAQVAVEPVNPIIRIFQADKESVFTGEEATLTWEVLSADEVTLTTNGVPETLLPTEHSGQRVVTPPTDSTYTLTARNRFGEVIESVEVQVNIPPVPTPFVRRFTVDKQVIVAGESIVLDWEVEGADIVQLSPLGEVPPVQSLSRTPLQSLEYILVASKGEARSQPIIREVVVNTPTPGPTATPEPQAPVIEFFTATPNELIRGEEETIDLAWSIIGQTTNIQISGPDVGLISGLSAQGSLSVTASEATLFILTAANGSLNASQTVQVTDQDPTPTPSPEPPTPTPLPLPEIVVFEISDPGPPLVTDLGGDNPRRYRVQVNTEVTFLWQVNSATTQAVLSTGGSPVAEGNPVSNFVTEITEAGTYVLTAENAEAKKVNKTIIIEITEQPPPDPPFSVSGAEETNVRNTIKWDWSFQVGKSDIEGFRIYRANVPGGNFAKIADEGTLKKDSPKEFIDTINPTCGKAYYIVAVYRNINGEIKETTASTTSWFSDPC